jgi:hypothetical protein
MTTLPKNVEKRIRDGIKKYKNVLKTAKDKDINEADTVTIVFNVLADICGYDRFLDLTKECAVKGTYCDIAIKLDDKIIFLIEVKAIGIALKDAHLRQAIQYASNSGTDWVILTNGDQWQVHKVIFGKPLKTELAIEFSFLETDKISKLMEFFFLLGKEGAKKSAINAYHEESQLTSRYIIAQVIQTNHIIDLIRKKLKSLSKKVTITNEDILLKLQTQILKREVTEGDEATIAKERLGIGSRKSIQRMNDERDMSGSLQGGDRLRYQFWNQFLDYAKAKTDLHANIKPTKYDWVGRRINGLWFNYAVGQHLSRAELWIDKGKDAEDENKEIFDKLAAARGDIEQSFGGSLEWERLDGKRACRIRKQIDLGGYLDEQKWPKIHEKMVDAMIRLHAALSPHI